MELSTSAVVLCHSVAVFENLFLFTENTVDIDRIQICKRNLTELTFSSFNYVNLKNMPLYLFIIGLASLHVMYFTTT